MKSILQAVFGFLIVCAIVGAIILAFIGLTKIFPSLDKPTGGSDQTTECDMFGCREE